MVSAKSTPAETKVISAFSPLVFVSSAVLLLSFFFLPLAAHALDVPKLQGYVNDYAGMMSPATTTEIERELKAFEESDSTQIVVLTIPSLEGEVIEDFGIKVGEAWKIGRKGKDNGAIFIVARQERKMRIEVGRGLEGKMTDLMAGRIIDLVVKPRFKRGDYDGGFRAGVSAMIDATRGEFKAEEPRRPQRRERSSDKILTFLIFGGIALLVLGSMSRVLGGIAGAAGLPLLFLLSGFSLGIVFIIILALVGLGAGLLLPLLFSSVGRYRGGGFGPGGGFFGGGGSGGGDFGGGGFSGGGDFGGGGASGDW